MILSKDQISPKNMNITSMLYRIKRDCDKEGFVSAHLIVLPISAAMGDLAHLHTGLKIEFGIDFLRQCTKSVPFWF